MSWVSSIGSIADEVCCFQRNPYLYSKTYMPMENLLREMAGIPTTGFHQEPILPLTDDELETVNLAFAKLIGLPLTNMFRYVGVQRFEFGEQQKWVTRKGKETTRAYWALNASCGWRITGPGSFTLCSDHFGPEEAKGDDHAEPFYALIHSDSPPTLEAVTVGLDGGLECSLSQGYTLTLWRSPKEDPRDEQWGLLPLKKGYLYLDDKTVGWSGTTDGAPGE